MGHIIDKEGYVDVYWGVGMLRSEEKLSLVEMDSQSNSVGTLEHGCWYIRGIKGVCMEGNVAAHRVQRGQKGHVGGT